MTLTVIEPPSGAAMGYGMRFKAHASTPAASGEWMLAQLSFVDAGSVTQLLAVGSGLISTGSGNAGVVFGLTYFGTFAEIYPIDPRGVALGTVIDLELRRYSPLSILMETQDFPGYFKHDPVSQAPNLLGQLLTLIHDPMLDEILASVKRVYSNA